MKGKRVEKILNLSMVMAGMAFLLFVITAPVIAQPVKVWVNVPEYAAEGGTFVATIAVTDVTNFKGGQFDLSFDSSVLELIDVGDGSLDGETIPLAMEKLVDADTVRVIVYMPMGEVVSGSGRLAKVSFLVKGEERDKSVLDLSNGLLVDRKAKEIPAEWIDAEVRIVKGVAAPTANHVYNINTSENFSSIQGAIDDPDTRDGDVIEVEDGVFYENVDVTKSLTIRSRNGSANCIVQAAKGNDNVFEITVDHACIRGFTVKGVFARGKAGINLNASHCCVSYNNCSNNDYGIHLEGSNSNSISNNICLNNWDEGISLEDANKNSISNNICSNNDCGIHLGKSNNNSISKNICSKNDEGISLEDASNNSISNNNCINNGDNGIRLIDSDNSSISQNNCSNNLAGIFLRGSKNNKLTTNILLENGMVIRGDSLSDYLQEIDESNRVNGKPVYYWKNRGGGRIPDGAGQVIIVNCSNVRVENQNINNASVGIKVAFSSFITIKNNSFSNNNWSGIHFDDSNNNSISNNNCSSNGYSGIHISASNDNTISNNNCSNNSNGIYAVASNSNTLANNNCYTNTNVGISLWFSNYNFIYLNNFINNTDNVYSFRCTNVWNTTEKIAYTYNKATYTTYLGNYWSDYAGSDSDGDGIGDTRYSIDSDKGKYPLMKHYEYYFASTENIFNQSFTLIKENHIKNDS